MPDPLIPPDATIRVWTCDCGYKALERFSGHPGSSDPQHPSMWRVTERVCVDLAAVGRLRNELRRAEAVLVAADRVHEAYEAMMEGRDVGRLPEWQPLDALGPGDDRAH